MDDKKRADLILRIAVFGTFLGHGILALTVKQAWITYLTTVGFSKEFAITIMPIIGLFDIIVAILALIKPFDGLFVWATIWAFATALIRPISGESIWDFVERTANWAAPLALLTLHGFFKKWKKVF